MVKINASKWYLYVFGTDDSRPNCNRYNFDTRSKCFWKSHISLSYINNLSYTPLSITLWILNKLKYLPLLMLSHLYKNIIFIGTPTDFARSLFY
jgi:hypothetical protein